MSVNDGWRVVEPGRVHERIVNGRRVAHIWKHGKLGWNAEAEGEVWAIACELWQHARSAVEGRIIAAQELDTQYQAQAMIGGAWFGETGWYPELWRVREHVAASRWRRMRIVRRTLEVVH